MNIWRPTLAIALGLALGACSDDKQPTTDAGPADGSSDVAVAPDSGADQAAPDSAPGKSGKLVILHTNDLHATVEGRDPVADYTPLTTGDDGTTGGFARLATVIAGARDRAGDRPVLLLDAGDYSMGSPFDMLASTSYPILALFEKLGYDAITIGNHELEDSPATTAAEIEAARQGGFKVPLLLANVKFDDQDAGDDALEALQEAGVIKSKIVKELPNGLKVGIFGLLGKPAWSVAYGLGSLTFADAAETAAAMVKELREEDGVDLVICLSHSGLAKDGTGADATLAEKVPGIDLIVGGHSHTLLQDPVQVGDTIIVQTGAYGGHLGQLELELVDGKLSVEQFTQLPVDDTVAGDAAIQKIVETYITEIDSLLAPQGLSYNKVLAETTFDLTFPDFQEAIAGNVITDAYRYAADAADPAAPADVALDSMGVIGDPMLKGKTGQLWLADVMRAAHAGRGPDGALGYPLVSFYITGKELHDGMEVVAIAEDVLKTQDYFMQLSGLRIEYSRSGGLFQRLTSLKIGEPAVEVDPAGCYKVVTTLIVGRWLSWVKDASYGALSVEAKDEGCTNLVTDLTTRIIDADPATDGVQELKAYKALADYLQSLPDTTGNGVPDIPASYALPQGRIVANP